MAAALVGGAFLGAFLNVVLDKLASPQVVNLIRRKKLDPKLLQRLETTLKVVGAVLNDAEQKQIRDSNINGWLDDLKDAVYMADDFLDEVSTKAATKKKQKQVSNSFSRLFNVQDRKMASKLEEIVVQLESILKLKKSLDLKEIAMENLSYKTPSTSLQDRSHIYGRDKDKEAIIKLLLNNNNNDGDEVPVIPIVGIGGVEKTTLAQLVYNDDNLKHDFDFKAWVCVSEQFDIMRVTKTIVQAVTCKACEMNDLNLLHLQLQKKLKGRKFLIVLDDVWIDDYDNWNLLRKPFQSGMRGSKILVTTPNENAASVVQTVQIYPLNNLSNEDCWLVFANHACISLGTCETTETLEEVGMKIVKRCKGLPLAAQSLGGILRRKRDIRDWNNILNCHIWELSESHSKIIPALRISYHYLPPHLKRCFVYCSLFPKDYEFEKKNLILLWMADAPKSGKSLEEVGYECFDYLVSRSFLQHSSTPQKESFIMHDLMHDLATFLAGEFYSRLESPGEEAKIHLKTRHLSFTKFSFPIFNNFEVFGTAKFLRTFLAINVDIKYEEVQCIMLSKLKFLRTLSFCFRNMNTLPDFVGKLIHLRYLDLSRTNVESLPESLCNLYNLQTLKLNGCFKLTILPTGMQNLVNLHCLDIGGTHLREMPSEMGKLSQLQHLTYFIVGKNEEIKIKQLGGLNLHGYFSIQKLRNVGNGSEAMEAKMMDKKHINNLQLDWSSRKGCISSETEIDILCKLQPHEDLQILEIKGYSGSKFPNWVGNSSYHHMTSLTLFSCENCCMLPTLGHLPSLKDLRISSMGKLKTIDASFYRNKDFFLLTPFPSLESLSFANMPCCEAWSSFEPHAFPRLKSLAVVYCPKLRGDLPSHFPALEELRIDSCKQLSCSLPWTPSMRRLTIIKMNKLVLQEFPLAIESLTVSSLKTLSIENFQKLEFPEQQQAQLESLVTPRSCYSLMSLPLEIFPNLRKLYISGCENLESLSVSQSQDVSLQHLSDLKIKGCPNLVSLSREGLAAPNLTRFVVSDCFKLESLPRRLNTLLPKLQRLEIRNCPRIELLPEQGMPPSLKEIYITNSEKLRNGPGIVWPSMNLRTAVWINSPCDGIKSFPKEGLLPPSLTCLGIMGLSSLETLDCKGLLQLTSLQQLSIANCPKLENMAGERLPASLPALDLHKCQLLGEKCSMKHPQIWLKISHIPYIEVDWKPIS